MDKLYSKGNQKVQVTEMDTSKREIFVLVAFHMNEVSWQETTV
jgi:hypothetical protein